MLKLLLRVLSLLALIPVTVHGQTHTSPFVEVGPLAESSSGIVGVGGHVELGIFVSPTWRIALGADAIKERYNESSWSNHSLIVGTTRPLTRTDRVAVELSGGIGPFRAKENGVAYHGKAAMFSVGPVIAVSRHFAIIPQLRGFITFEAHDAPGSVSTFGLGVRLR
jgi:hypothetical protein